MLKKILLSVTFLAVLAGCQQEDQMSPLAIDDLVVAEITEDELPATASAFILENYEGEIITSAFKISSNEEVTYEANLTNQMNLVFASNGRLQAFGEEGSEVDCRGKHRKRGGFGRPPGDSDEERPKPVSLDLEDLPTEAASYLSENYAENEILKIIYIERDELNQYHVLIKKTGLVIFDGDGTFLEFKEKPERNCANFQAVELEDLPEAITSYVAENYPDNEVLRARMGSRNEQVEFHVLVKGTGVLIFDENGEFIELKTCGMDKG